MKHDRKIFPDLVEIDGKREISAEVYGARAASVSALMGANLPVPRSWAISVEAFRDFTKSGFMQDWRISESLGDHPIVSVRASPIKRAWAGPETIG